MAQTMNEPLEIILAEPRGFCAGVDRAIEIVERALQLYGAPVYVRHEIVHNKWVVQDLKTKGVVFVREVDEIPDGAITVFSAHGISEKVEHSAKLRDLPVIDATCPLVTKVHKEAQRYEAEGRQIILIGHDGHPEVEGTSGRVKNGVLLVEDEEDVRSLKVEDENKLAYVTQTTLSVDDTRNIITLLKQRFPNIAGPELRDICYATQNRQNAVRELAEQVDLLLVIGSANSSNSNRLRDLAAEIGIPAHLIDDATALKPDWFYTIHKVGITAGASAPEHLVQDVVSAIGKIRATTSRGMNGQSESTRFKLPAEVTGEKRLRA
ncbi:MAG: 4-hydroxy-3-methylbut-2-enyl diphosphate reductase [Rickettsiales bacterium]|jgi:4-hydroxy-3-methylbut-2-enyl diphosphate reductase|nr:4-hydroxy-3-methylbut-2-enyl diphosphate reductase [Rickettsiales bacterium]